MVPKAAKSSKNDDVPSPAPEEWSCYGTTEVDLLVLRPENSKEERIVAVAPYCSPGMTIRDVAVHDEDDDATLLGKDRTNTIRLGFLEILYQSSIEDPAAAANRRDSIGNNSSDSNNNNNVLEPRPSFWTRFTKSSSMIAKQMQINAHLLAETTQDDFYNRTKSASEKILQEIPKTWDRTTNLMWRVVTWDWSFPPGDDDGSGGRPPRF